MQNNSSDLSTIGATEEVKESLRPLRAPEGLILGPRIGCPIANSTASTPAHGGEIEKLKPIGALLYRADRSEWPAVGDWGGGPASSAQLKQ